MTNVYVLHHVHSFPTGLDNVKLIGVYSSRANAEAAVTRVGQTPGFAAARKGFTSRNTRSTWTTGEKAM